MAQTQDPTTGTAQPTVSTHLRNQIHAAIAHASASHTGPLSATNTITDAVVATIEAHTSCSHC